MEQDFFFSLFNNTKQWDVEENGFSISLCVCVCVTYSILATATIEIFK